MDSRIHKHLPALLALAHDRSESGRLALAEKLAHVFLSQSAALSTHEEEMVGELIDELLKNESQTVRQSLINHFAEAINAPRAIALRIVRGPIDIARPVIVANENLGDEDLVSVIKTKAREHAMAVASRAEISEAVADALVSTGDLRIMQIVAENMGAKLSAKTLDVLVDAARLAAMLQKPILSRPELKVDDAARLYWWVARDLRRVTLDRYGFGPNRLETELSKAIEEKLRLHTVEKEDDEAMMIVADWLAERDAQNAKTLPQLLRAGHYRLFNIVISRLAKIDLSLVDIITTAAGGRMMVALCRAINIDKGNFVSIFLMSRGGRPDEQVVHPRELSQALAAYDRLQPETAEAMLNSWRMNPADLIARAQEAGAEA